MKNIWKLLCSRRLDVERHPFFEWLNADHTPLERRFIFSPVMVDFIMSFADMNKLFLSYENPMSDLERGINEHTDEDRTHSRLFHDNWYTLKLDQEFDWPSGKALWWLFQGKDTAIVRRFGMGVLELAVRHPAPLVRFALMEAIEVCGDVFFANTAPIAAALSARDGEPHHYYGHYHRALETGHLHTDEADFRKSTLDDASRALAERAVNKVFDNFLAVLDQLLDYSMRATSDTETLQRSIEAEYQAAVKAPTLVPVVPFALAQPFAISSTQLGLLTLLDRRTERLRQHPLLAWLSAGTETTAMEKLQSFVALWGVDILGYSDFNQLVLSYPAPVSEGERRLNAWTSELATHASLYAHDWRVLDMDQLLGWDMGDTIAFYFLSQQTEIHRGNMAKVKKLAFSHQQPILRWWLLHALESFGEPLFECTARLAEMIEASRGIVLPYWGNRHSSAHGAAGAQINHDEFFLSQHISEAERAVAIDMIDTIFDNLERQFTLSYAEALSKSFIAASATLPPARLHGVSFRDIVPVTEAG